MVLFVRCSLEAASSYPLSIAYLVSVTDFFQGCADVYPSSVIVTIMHPIPFPLPTWWVWQTFSKGLQMFTSLLLLSPSSYSRCLAVAYLMGVTDEPLRRKHRGTLCAFWQIGRVNKQYRMEMKMCNIDMRNLWPLVFERMRGWDVVSGEGSPMHVAPGAVKACICICIWKNQRL